MIATNHYLAGAMIGVALPLGYAIPTALLSHILMDLVPHYGIPKKTRDNSKIYRKIVLADTSAMIAVAFVAMMFGQWQMFWVGWISYSPDLAWVYIHFRRGGTFVLQAENWLAKVHEKIQIYERPWGMVVDLTIAVSLFAIFVNYIT